MRGSEAVAASRAGLDRALHDEAPSVRIVAAQGLGQFGSEADAQRALDVLLPLADVNKNDYWVCVEALNAIDYLDDRATGTRRHQRASSRSERRQTLRICAAPCRKNPSRLQN
jgi:hypothetical protein